MKTILGLLLTVCTLAAQSLSDPAFVAALTVPASGACATTDTAILHDEFLEGFQTATTGVNDGNAWTVSTIGLTELLDPVYDVSTIFSGISGACSQGLRAVVTNSTETAYVWDRGSDLDLDTQAVTITLYVRFLALGLSGTENISIFDTATSADSINYQVTLGFVTDHHELKIDASVDTGTSYTVTTDTTYKLEIHLGTTTSACWFDVNDASGTANTFTRFSARDLRKVRAGSPLAVDSADAGPVIVFDLICIDKD